MSFRCGPDTDTALEARQTRAVFSGVILLRFVCVRRRPHRTVLFRPCFLCMEELKLNNAKIRFVLIRVELLRHYCRLPKSTYGCHPASQLLPYLHYPHFGRIHLFRLVVMLMSELGQSRADGAWKCVAPIQLLSNSIYRRVYTVHFQVASTD